MRREDWFCFNGGGGMSVGYKGRDYYGVMRDIE